MWTASKATYCCGQLEAGAEGTPHLQIFLNFKEPKRCAAIKKIDNKLHIDVVSVNNGADAYCMKEDTRVEGPWEFGTKPVRRNNKTDWQQVWDAAKEGKLDNIDPQIRIRHYNSLTKIAKDHLPKYDADGVRGIWIQGTSGVGKSRLAREISGNKHYPKLLNKWFDGYQGERHIIMDDIGEDHKCLGH